MEATPTYFGLQRNHPQGAAASNQLKLQVWFGVDIDVVQTLSVLWRHSMIEPVEQGNEPLSYVKYGKFID